MCHFVICSPQLEAEHGLKVFSLEHDIAFESVAEVCGVGEGGFGDDFVHTGGENEAKVLRRVRNWCSFLLRLGIISHTSGYPVGSKNASGTPWFVLGCGESDGGLALAEYSVRARPVFLGVRGVRMPLASASGVTGRE
jgi:hypothetical protein